ncbi:MtrAB system histidine kinase MtrB [Streptacidiphilus fuscans]|uniref:Sensor histidine kinase MtrB n=1 Tax=Streptacidiphilus fuscans TaxID=2789292 RepID=A0A931B977_9ACTN|nr:MtrAB system histidine kinase MtrB [Streptacidiphilus fuscans]MBF9072508.1 HAMP domain-containing histidine kinase [Streptacidiphilus fuscans]
MTGQTPAVLPDQDGGQSTGTDDSRNAADSRDTVAGRKSTDGRRSRSGASATDGSTRALLVVVGRRLRSPFRRAVGLYRRSIQLRVVATTLVLSVGVVALLGVVVMNQVRNGLLQAKLQSAQTQADSGFAAAKAATSSLGADTHKAVPGSATTPGSTYSVDVGDVMTEQVHSLAASGAGSYYVLGMLPDDTQASDTSPALRAVRDTGHVDPQTIPAELQARVAEGNGTPQGSFSTVTYLNGTPSEPGMVLGEQIAVPDGSSYQNSYQLYYVFPFTQETKTLSLVSGTLATAGVFVVILLGAISWLVVRQVVTPIRMAAEISEQLASGRLEERMKVSGTDDITRLGESFNRMAGALQAQIRQLEELSRVQRRFVSDVSHELRTPLTTVRMAADLLYESREDFDDPAAARSAELLQNQLDRFESLLADLLEISRFDAGAAILDSEPADLRDVVARVIEGADPLAKRKGSTIHVLGGDEPVVAEVDPRRIERILRNLVVNALEHGEGRDIDVRLAAGDGAVAVAVRDRGIGLKPGEAARVFNRFWRADPARARTTGGTGLGLSIALEDAALHGGWLHAWGEPGGGSQFRLTIPRNAGAEISRSPIPLEPGDSRGNRGLDVSGSPYRRARPAGATAVLAAGATGGHASGHVRAAGAGSVGGVDGVGETELSGQQPSLGPGLGGVLGYGSVIPTLPGPGRPGPASNPADLGTVPGFALGSGGAQVVVPKEACEPAPGAETGADVAVPPSDGAAADHIGGEATSRNGGNDGEK